MNISHSLILPSLDHLQAELKDLSSRLETAKVNDKEEINEIIEACNHLIAELRDEVSLDQTGDVAKYRNVFRQIKLGTRSLKRRFQREILNHNRFQKNASGEVYVSKAAA